MAWFWPAWRSSLLRRGGLFFDNCNYFTRNNWGARNKKKQEKLAISWEREFSYKDCEVFDEEIPLEFGESRQAGCPRCGTLSQNRHEIGKLRKIYNGYGFGRRVYLLLRKGRYFCKRCKRSFTERLSMVLPRQRKKTAEQRLKDLIEIAFLSDDAAMVQ